MQRSSIIVVVLLLMILLGCSGGGVKSVTLEPRYVSGMPIAKVPNSEIPTYLPLEDLLIDENYQVWLPSVAKTMMEPPENQPFLQIYRAEGKFYVITYGTKTFQLSSSQNASKRHGCYNKLAIEKIVVVVDRKNWREDPFAEAFKDKPALDNSMVAKK